MVCTLKGTSQTRRRRPLYRHPSAMTSSKGIYTPIVHPVIHAYTPYIHHIYTSKHPLIAPYTPHIPTFLRPHPIYTPLYTSFTPYTPHYTPHIPPSNLPPPSSLLSHLSSLLPSLSSLYFERVGHRMHVAFVNLQARSQKKKVETQASLRNIFRKRTQVGVKGTCEAIMLYTLYTPFIHPLCYYVHLCTPVICTRYTCVYTICTPYIHR